MPYMGSLSAEDEAGGFPSQYMGQFGLEFWGRSELASTDWHAYLEYSDTTCRFTQSDPSFNCAYNNVFYPDGYRYRGRSIGYSTDNDARTMTVGLLARHDSVGRLHAMLRVSELNRGGLPDLSNGITATPKDLVDASVVYARDTDFGQWEFSLGAQRLEDPISSANDTDISGFVKWTQEF